MARNPVGFEITNSTAGWNGADFDDVFIRKDCFLEGGLWLWGCGSFGRLGNNALSAVSSPVQTISGGTNWRSVSGYSGIKTDGTLWTWGGNFDGQLGNGNIIDRSSPVQTVSGGTGWKLATTSNQTTAAIKNDGSLWLWGSGSFGQLGTNLSGAAASRSSPVQTVSVGTNWKSVTIGTAHTAAIKTDGTLWLWGCNTNGQLGNQNIINVSSPVQTISAGTNWKSISSTSIMAVAIKTDGTLWMWGSGNGGRLGNGFTVNVSSPIQTVSGGTNWKCAATGATHVAGIKTDGTLWVWGASTFGSLGDGFAADRSSPVQTISGGTNWREIGLGTWNSAAIKTDGTLWTWGYNTIGALGTNNTISRSSPVQTITGGTIWKKLNPKVVTSVIREDCW